MTQHYRRRSTGREVPSARISGRLRARGRVPGDFRPRPVPLHAPPTRRCTLTPCASARFVWLWQRTHYVVQVATTTHHILCRLPQPTPTTLPPRGEVAAHTQWCRKRGDIRVADLP